ncbi:hypothetical protein Desca_1364 [Desulfotomaculum nigrificans CO-1-SRB]|uniref:Uncharacterized protein n=1 Tax=Desulfotomaculum nigrificans (strain DSM 14880 / VKM B-2319 / CO-1-SRB) TaxID=868595 RepID=F6B5A2_DESCC|nr:hypothetical protein [Desulfotomaculum nigrificans]AEF94223.1 hypothetical protein Desca_1364 [Desulfotomaculum nigrificans CO-1-SRB]
MPEQENKVVNIDQEIINKHTDSFVNITTILGSLLKKDLARFSFNYDESTVTLDSSPEVLDAFANYSPDKVQSVMEEIVTITLKLLDNQEAALLQEAANEGKTTHMILQKKIEAIKNNIDLKTLQNGYYFYRTCIGNVLDQFIAQKIVKPPSGRFPAIETAMIRISAKDNHNNGNSQSINFELYPYQIDDIINTLSQLKQEFTIESSHSKSS